ncbi:MAG TPA: biotin attachment protein [Flavobacteriales bacterium]|nr:biotin attachment protein [Flavobacteriales bacterium]HCA82591.1 biotin attachment protein [Flavobacteriales bacterium]HRE76138.1 HlyD family efflux transporter periplasmic adaptor subunit [Flavobacteriales bacterium]HRJ34590.1 HlyD family efflux transporter periplasmic adaptor subunit [Flavobacteriales bacterium]HRJ38187.1 HlyD family efflux transporter periplasmic adaptor subunit [Flavobacteriales bacterium]
MLNISPKSISGKIDPSKYNSFAAIGQYPLARRILLWLTIIFGVFLLFLFLPWTQNILATGQITTLRPEQRPHTIHSTIPGRIEKWYVQEGQHVDRGDTIAFISEIKDDYFDPKLLQNTEDQLKAKEQSIDSYQSKVNALNKQIDALNETLILKLEQTRNKIKQAELKLKSDSIDYEASITNYTIAEQQYNRYIELKEKDVISQTDLEGRKLKFQEAMAKKISAENKVLASRNELLNSKIELNTIETEYNDKLMKAESDKYSAISTVFDTEAAVAKLQSQFSGYAIRSGYYFITAPQDGYVTKALTTGIGETIKEGTPIVSIMPSKYELAVEVFVEPMDLPLLVLGQPVRLVFDGWPSFVFSGWPGASFGTFGGKIVAVDNLMSDNGKYRVLVSPDRNDEPWPVALRVGTGARGMMLLQDVPIWYELWRKLNGFPPEFYQPANPANAKNNEKKK